MHVRTIIDELALVLKYTGTSQLIDEYFVTDCKLFLQLFFEDGAKQNVHKGDSSCVHL